MRSGELVMRNLFCAQYNCTSRRYSTDIEERLNMKLRAAFKEPDIPVLAVPVKTIWPTADPRQVYFEVYTLETLQAIMLPLLRKSAYFFRHNMLVDKNSVDNISMNLFLKRAFEEEGWSAKHFPHGTRKEVVLSELLSNL